MRELTHAFVIITFSFMPIFHVGLEHSKRTCSAGKESKLRACTGKGGDRGLITGHAGDRVRDETGSV